MSEYDVGLVCLNGHEITSTAASSPAHRTKFCTQCGEATIDRCPACNAAIRGYYHVSGTVGLCRWTAPSHCHECGEPYPWTQRRSEALAETIDELGALSDDERDRLKQSIPDILAETPKSEAAGLRFKKAAAKLGAAGGKVLTDVLTKVAAETVKQSMGL